MPDRSMWRRNPWGVHVLSAAVFVVAGGLLAWRGTGGAGVGYGLVVVAVLNLGLAWVLYRRGRGRQGRRGAY